MPVRKSSRTHIIYVPIKAPSSHRRKSHHSRPVKGSIEAKRLMAKVRAAKHHY